MGNSRYPARLACPCGDADILISVDKINTSPIKADGHTAKKVQDPVVPYVRHPYAFADLACSAESDEDLPEDAV